MAAFAKSWRRGVKKSRGNASINARPADRVTADRGWGLPRPLHGSVMPEKNYVPNAACRRSLSAWRLGKRPDQSCPLRVISRTPAGSRRTIMRKPSSFISWIQPAPDGGRSAGEGRQGSINADTRIARDFSGRRPLPSSRSASGACGVVVLRCAYWSDSGVRRA
jgi:hypothetical protein